MALRGDAAVFLNWWEWLKETAERAGITIPSGLTSQAAQARGYFEIGRYEEAYSMASAAVRDFRALLKGQREQFKARCDGLVSSINTARNSAIASGIEVGAFTDAYNGSLAMYNGGDFLGAFHALSFLAEDLANYVSSARMGRLVLPVSGTYDIPAGTTDILVFNNIKVESTGWLYSSEEEIRDMLRPLVIEAGGEDVLGVRVMGPRTIVYIKGSPIFWFLLASLIVKILIIIFAAVTLIYIFAIPAIRHEEEEGLLARRKADLMDSYNKYVADKVAAGELTPEVANQLTGEYADNMATIKIPEGGWGITDYLKLGAGIAIVGVALYFAVPMLKGAFRKGDKK
jgi:hypothetical protein